MVAIGPVVSEEKSFEIVDGRRTDGRTTDGRRTTEPAYTISSPGAFGSGELKKLAKLYHIENSKTHYEPPHQDLRCLQIQFFSSLSLKELKLDLSIIYLRLDRSPTNLDMVAYKILTRPLNFNPTAKSLSHHARMVFVK